VKFSKRSVERKDWGEKTSVNKYEHFGHQRIAAPMQLLDLIGAVGRQVHPMALSSHPSPRPTGPSWCGVESHTEGRQTDHEQSLVAVHAFVPDDIFRVYLIIVIDHNFPVCTTALLPIAKHTMVGSVHA